MDTRLFSIGTRLGRLRTQDLPLLARAIVSYYRGQAKVTTGITRNVRYVRLNTFGSQVQVLAEDWAKILVCVQNDEFRQFFYQTDQHYNKVLSILRLIFTESYPTASKSSVVDLRTLTALSPVDNLDTLDQVVLEKT